MNTYKLTIDVTSSVIYFQDGFLNVSYENNSQVNDYTFEGTNVNVNLIEGKVQVSQVNGIDDVASEKGITTFIVSFAFQGTIVKLNCSIISFLHGLVD